MSHDDGHVPDAICLVRVTKPTQLAVTNDGRIVYTAVDNSGYVYETHVEFATPDLLADAINNMIRAYGTLIADELRAAL